MNCESAQTMLERCFDDHLDASPELKQHLETCAGCRAMADEFSALDRMLGDLPLDAPEGIEDRVLLALHADDARRNRPVLIGLVSACVLFSVGLLNWLLPIDALQAKASQQLHAWVPEMEWMESGQPFMEQVDATWAQAQGLYQSAEWVSSPMIWSSLIAAVLVLLMVNGICAVQYRHTSR